MGVLVIPEGKTALFRAAIFIGLGTVVTTIIYLTPVPDQYPQSCSRPCHELDWPMICRVKLTLERYQTLGSSCRDCPGNATDCGRSSCIAVDGRRRGILAANREFPGPTLQVCQHDIMVVDVVNRIPGQSFGVHWRGQPQSETPYMDGVPMVTQCPIPSLTTFQYKFRASEAGTHVWEVNTGEELLETLMGPLIVRRPDSKEVHRSLYDTDDMENVVVVHGWNPQRSSYLFEDEAAEVKLLINGRTEENNVPPSVFSVSRGRRHRFRVIYMGGTNSCQVRLSVDRHRLLVIALDGQSIKPRMVTSVRLFPGERLDFVLRGDQTPGQYYMRATPAASCSGVTATKAVIRYDQIAVPPAGPPEEPPSPEAAELRTLHDEDCHPNSPHVCMNDIAAATPIPEDLTAHEPDTRLYLFYKSAVVHKTSTVNTTFVAIDDTVTVPQTNNLTMMLPPSPLLSQSHHISPADLCNSDSVPDRCLAAAICECVHVLDVPLNAVLELVLVNQDPQHHVFHLHGYTFRVLASSRLPPSLTPERVKQLDSENKLVRRNFRHPAAKDTVGVGGSGVAVLRLKADNPGYWMLEEERGRYWSRGMGVVLHVGRKSDLTPIPHNFPKCGDWIGPEFFLV